MPAIVSDVELGSIADEINIEAGDEILSIDGCELTDLIDYNFYCKTEFLTLSIKKLNGELEDIEIEKDYDEPLGIIFESAVFDKIKPCLNKCIFCFVDQQPKGLRDTLYIKDDDYRLSYLQGTYITLTNLKDEDKNRIARMHLGPLYVSVHTTNPELRVKMLKNPNAKNIMEHLKWFKKQEIPIHCQIVLCPGYNDGKELDRTLKDLKSLKNTVLSIAIVPVGLTQFRKDELQKVDEKVAKETLKIASKYKGVCCSDEFFLLAGEEIPPSEYYGNFSQLSDGVGSLRLLIDEFKAQKLPKSIKQQTKFIIATSFAAKSAIEFICEELNKIKNLTCECVPVKSTYWGNNITVAGLITSDDLANALKDKRSDITIIPSVMLKPFSEDFLDGNNLNYVREKTKHKFFVVQNSNSAKEIVELIKTL
ncbi:DUF512 domain-containing protein [bacterium]|nr:DUF512 domain-containing protein [bacterium]